MDYSELIKQLRYCANADPICDMTEVCPFYDQRDEEYGDYRCVERMMENAADAIEELQATLCQWCAVCPYDKRDLSTCEIYESCRAKPPKEET